MSEYNEFVKPEDLNQDDCVLVTGTASSPRKRFVELKCVVATASPDAVKVWPALDDDPQLTPDERRIGKIWFAHENIESVRWAYD